MAVTGGDILEITFNNPTIGTGRFFAKAAEDSTFNLGGFRGDDDKNGIDGGGRNIRKINAVRWGFEVLVSWDMNIDNELQKLIDLSKEQTESDWTINHINGTTWSGKGSPVGETDGNGNASTFTLKVSGGGVLKKII